MSLYEVKYSKSLKSKVLVVDAQCHSDKVKQTDAGPVQFINGQFVLVAFDKTLKVYKPVLCSDPKVLRTKTKINEDIKTFQTVAGPMQLWDRRWGSYYNEPMILYYLSGVRPESKNCDVKVA